MAVLYHVIYYFHRVIVVYFFEIAEAGLSSYLVSSLRNSLVQQVGFSLYFDYLKKVIIFQKRYIQSDPGLRENNENFEI